MTTSGALRAGEKQTVDQQVLTRLDERTLMSTPPDQTSIMCYQLPGSITRDGRPILGGADINATDYLFAGRIYPNQGNGWPRPNRLTSGPKLTTWISTQQICTPPSHDDRAAMSGRLIEIQRGEDAPNTIRALPGDVLWIGGAGGQVRGRRDIVDLIGAFLPAVVTAAGEVIAPMGRPSIVLFIALGAGVGTIEVFTGTPWSAATRRTIEIIVEVPSAITNTV
jgi:hypothetical protein